MKKNNNKVRYWIFGANTVFYLVCIIIGIIGLFTPIFSGSQAKLIITEGIQAIFFLCLTILVSKISKMYIPIIVDICAACFIFVAVFLGEALSLYYKIPCWDIVLHTLSGFLLVLLCYYVATVVFKNNPKRIFGKLFFAISLTLSIGVLWEVVEFIIDRLTGTNMQHFMPENSEIFNGGLSNKDLVGTDEQIANYYRHPSGYSYGIMDTMQDLICNFIGALIGFFSTWFYVRVKQKKNDIAILYQDTYNTTNSFDVHIENSTIEDIKYKDLTIEKSNKKKDISKNKESNEDK